MRFALPILLCLATFSFALGITLPLLRIERLYLLSDEPSLVMIVDGLLRDGDWPLALLVGLFSILFPALKLMTLHVTAFSGTDEPFDLPAWLRAVAKWSMLDVLLVALIVFAAKTSGLASAFTLPGLWFFAASVMLTAAATMVARRRVPTGS